ncbi:hypothetical protein DI270_017020 [Microbispora triticiradicis]|uniref:Uncharacterized protein n=1 Tax=Microbispora triticiradicis TaxID=2200763 RepID=A0ABX9LIT4_9ACTN|nr:hypothetical protein [Microbispora triticiradicis]RGA03799.1 hypothetical protein DI270_017020 [Microbispora triticiradicis]GLW24140.1 hypothetical protein Mame01_41830 [Microbispora amethystogenes]
MSGLFDGAVAFLDRRQLTSVWMPLTAFLAALVTVAVSGTGWGRTLTWWNGLAGETRILLVLGAVLVTVLAGQLLAVARPGLVRWYEGHWPDSPLLRPLRRALLARHLAAQSVRRAADADLFLGYPRTAQRTLPTRLGNVLRAAEEHGDRYGMDATTVWPRLYTVLPDPFLASFAQAAAAMETAVMISFLGGAFAVVGGTLAVLVLPGAGAVCCVWGGALVAILGYRGAVRAARPYAQLIRSAFDVHRFLLLEAMRLRLPESPAQERAQWEQLGKLWYRGAPDYDRIPALRYPASSAPSPEPARLVTSGDPAPVKALPVAAAPVRTGRAFPVRSSLAGVVVLAGVGAAATAPALGPDGEIRATRDLPAFHVLVPADLEGEGAGRLSGRYTVTPVAKGGAPSDLGPPLGAALTGRVATTVPVAAVRVQRGQVVSLRTAKGMFGGLLALDVPDKDTLVVAVPAADLDALSRGLDAGPVRLVLPVG